VRPGSELKLDETRLATRVDLEVADFASKLVVIGIIPR